MIRLLIVLIGITFVGPLRAHDVIGGCDHSMMNGTWEVFFPDGIPPTNTTIEEDASLYLRHVGKIKGKEMYAADLIGSSWKMDLSAELTAACEERLVVLTVPILRERTEAQLCLARVNDIAGLMKRKNQDSPKLRQLAIEYQDRSDRCDVSAATPRSPGHVHADN